MTPSISLIYNNNPSFTVIELENSKISEAISWSFDLTAYTFFRGQRWTKIDWLKEFGIDLNDGNTVKELFQRMMNDQYLFNKYEAACYGMSWIEKKW